MNKAERIYVILYCAFLLIYLPVVYIMGKPPLSITLPVHLPGLAVSLPLLVAVFADLYRRKTLSTNRKLTWAIVMLMFWPSILVYLFRHGFQPRQQATA